MYNALFALSVPLLRYTRRYEWFNTCGPHERFLPWPDGWDLRLNGLVDSYAPDLCACTLLQVVSRFVARLWFHLRAALHEW
jgi:hypothetical protein